MELPETCGMWVAATSKGEGGKYPKQALKGDLQLKFGLLCCRNVVCKLDFHPKYLDAYNYDPSKVVLKSY